MQEVLDGTNVRNFNPRSGERSDHMNMVIISILKQFQSTLRRTERRRTQITIMRMNLNFNPRSGERSDFFQLRPFS